MRRRYLFDTGIAQDYQAGRSRTRAGQSTWETLRKEQQMAPISEGLADVEAGRVTPIGDSIARIRRQLGFSQRVAMKYTVVNIRRSERDLCNAASWWSRALVDRESLGRPGGGRVWGWYFLPADAQLGLPERIIDLRRLHTIQIDPLRSPVNYEGFVANQLPALQLRRCPLQRAGGDRGPAQRVPEGAAAPATRDQRIASRLE